MEQTPIDEPTSQFLEAAADDLQRQLGIAGEVETIWLGRTPRGVGLRAHVRVAQRAIDVDGYGESILTAYADLRMRLAEPTLVAAFSQLVDSGRKGP
jgi:hypothetical protein